MKTVKKKTIQKDLEKALQLHRTEQLDEALKIYLKTEKLAPNDPNIKYLIGVVNYQKRNFEQAVSYINEAIKINPNDAKYYHNLGNSLTSLNHYNEAVLAYEEAVSIQAGDYLEATYNLGAVLHKLGKWQKEIEYYYLALTKNPKDPTLLFEMIKAMQRACYWNHLDEYEKHLLAVTKHDIKEKILPALTPYHSLTLDIDPILKKQIAKNYAHLKYQSMKQIGQFDQSANKNIKIGYIFESAQEDSISEILNIICSNHNNELFDVNIYVYGPDNNLANKDYTISHSKYNNLKGKRPEQIARSIYNDKIDILIDLVGYTDNALVSVLAMRPAPVQISYLTYPGTMGAKFIDYLITDYIAVPKNSKKLYTEKLLFLPNSYYLSTEIRKDTKTKSPINIPENKFVFCCFNSSYKIDKETFTCWMKILKEVENSVLLLSIDNDFVKSNLLIEASSKSIDKSRIIFASDEYNLYQHAHLYLDTFHINARRDACKALYNHLPVLTLAGNDIISRSCASILNAADLTELITYSTQEYINTAIKYASNADHFKQLKQKLDKNIKSKALFNHKNYVKELENILLKAYKKIIKV